MFTEPHRYLLEVTRIEIDRRNLDDPGRLLFSRLHDCWCNPDEPDLPPWYDSPAEAYETVMAELLDLDHEELLCYEHPLCNECREQPAAYDGLCYQCQCMLHDCGRYDMGHEGWMYR